MSRRPPIQMKAPGGRSRQGNQSNSSTTNQQSDDPASGYMSQSETGAFMSEIDYSDARPSHITSSHRSSTPATQPKQPPSRRNQPTATTSRQPQPSTNNQPINIPTSHYDPNFSDEQTHGQSPLDKYVSASDHEDIFGEFDHTSAISALSHTMNASLNNNNNSNPFNGNAAQGDPFGSGPTSTSHSQQPPSAFHANSTLPFALRNDDFDLQSGGLTADERNEMNQHLMHTFDFAQLDQFPQEVLESQIKSRYMIQIQNIVGVVDLKCQIDLKRVVLGLRNSEYNPRRFLSVVIRLRDPKVTGLVFQSGKLVLTGAKSEFQTHLGARKIARLIQKLGHPDVTFNNFQFTNIVGYTDVRFPIDLQHLIHKHPQYCEFDPELFPALVYRVQHPPCAVSIFVNGKVLITGARTRAELYQAFEIIYPVLCEFKKGSQIDSLGAPASAFEDSVASAIDTAPAMIEHSANESALLLGNGLDDDFGGFDDYD